MKSYKEYLSKKGTVQEKAKVDPTADTGPDAASQPLTAATKGKNWEAQVKSGGKPAPYTPSTKPVPQEWPHKYETGLGDKGKKEFFKAPKAGEPQKEGGKKIGGWPKTTKEFLQHTRGMNLTEFANFMLSYQENTSELPPPSHDPVMATRYVAALADANDQILETLVWELRRSGSFCRLVEEVSKHNCDCSETTDAPASETEVGGEKKKVGPPRTPRTPKTIGNDKNPMDLSGSGVEATKAK